MSESSATLLAFPAPPTPTALLEALIGRPVADLPPLLTPEEASSLLKGAVPARRIRDAVRAGQFPGMEVGASIMVLTAPFLTTLAGGRAA